MTRVHEQSRIGQYLVAWFIQSLLDTVKNYLLTHEQDSKALAPRWVGVQFLFVSSALRNVTVPLLPYICKRRDITTQSLPAGLACSFSPSKADIIPY